MTVRIADTIGGIKKAGSEEGEKYAE